MCLHNVLIIEYNIRVFFLFLSLVPFPFSLMLIFVLFFCLIVVKLFFKKTKTLIYRPKFSVFFFLTYFSFLLTPSRRSLSVTMHLTIVFVVGSFHSPIVLVIILVMVDDGLLLSVREVQKAYRGHRAYQMTNRHRDP